jgi:hypothetical protein
VLAHVAVDLAGVVRAWRRNARPMAFQAEELGIVEVRLDTVVEEREVGLGP